MHAIQLVVVRRLAVMWAGADACQACLRRRNYDAADDAALGHPGSTPRLADKGHHRAHRRSGESSRVAWVGGPEPDAGKAWAGLQALGSGLRVTQPLRARYAPLLIRGSQSPMICSSVYGHVSGSAAAFASSP